MENTLYAVVDNATESEREKNNDYQKYSYNDFSRLKFRIQNINQNLRQLSTICLGYDIYKIYKLKDEFYLVSKNTGTSVEFYKCNGEDGLLMCLKNI